MNIIECPNGFYDFVEKNFLSSVNLSFPESPSGYFGQGVDVYLKRTIRIEDWNYRIDTDYLFHRYDYFQDVGGEVDGYYFSSVDYTHYYPTLINQQTYSMSMDEAYMFIKPELPGEIPYIYSYSQKDNHKGKSLVTFTVKNIPSSTTELKFLVCPSSATTFDNDSWQTITMDMNFVNTFSVEVDPSTDYVIVLETIVDGYPKQNAISFTSMDLNQVYVKYNGSYVKGIVYGKIDNQYVISNGIGFNNGSVYNN